MGKRLALLILLALPFCVRPTLWAQTPCTPTGAGVCRYVATNGSDSNPGTSAQPYLTIQHAADLVNPGDEVIVRSGTYTGGSGTLVSVSRSGTATNPIVFVSDVQFGAKLDGSNNTTTEGWSVNGAYVTIKDFEIANFNTIAIENSGNKGPGLHVVGNNIHDIGRVCTNSSQGHDAIFLNSGNEIIEQNLIHDIGRFNIGENGCSLSQWQYYQQLDHAIYVGTYQPVVNGEIIRNNVFWRNLQGWSVQVYPNGAPNISIVNNTFLGSKFGSGGLNAGHVVTYQGGTCYSNLLIENNLFIDPNIAGVQLAGCYSTSTVANNITRSGTTLDRSVSGLTTSSNRDNTDPLIVSTGSTSIDGANPDPHLQSSSPAIDSGLTIAGVTVDLYGTTRPQGHSYDIGAVEMPNPSASRPSPPQNLTVTVN